MMCTQIFSYTFIVLFFFKLALLFPNMIITEINLITVNLFIIFLTELLNILVDNNR